MSSMEASFTFGTEVTFENLTILPLLRESSSETDYDTLDVALANDTLLITEVSDAGNLPEIKVQNTGGRPVLIIDGEELVGAKQNRTVNVSILVPPKSAVVVPVTCVEAGRWSARSRRFTSAPRTHFATGRAAKSTQINASLLSEGIARADQSEIWRQIAEKSARLEAPRTAFDAPGMGETWRLSAPGVSGGGLDVSGTIVHLSGFRGSGA